MLALGVERLAYQHAIVKKPSSVETLVSGAVICCDKTGTLTRGEMTVGRVLIPSGDVELTGTGFSPEGAALQGGQQLTDLVLLDEACVVLVGASLATDATVHHEGGTLVVRGDPTEGSLRVARVKLGIRAEDLEARPRRVGEVPFTAERKFDEHPSARPAGRHATRHRHQGCARGPVGALCPERAAGQLRGLTPQRRGEIPSAIERLADDALRTLAVAYRPVADDAEVAGREELERDLAYLRAVGIIDPPRAEAQAAGAEAHRAGIRVLMITGDHPRTATRIAEELDISRPGGTRCHRDRAGDRQRRGAPAGSPVSVGLPRVAPEQKLRIVDALQADGRVVAMTGGGVNDAPALKSADIDIAMGITGTDVANEAAKIILTDDNFATIVAAGAETAPSCPTSAGSCGTCSPRTSAKSSPRSPASSSPAAPTGGARGRDLLGDHAASLWCRCSPCAASDWEARVRCPARPKGLALRTASGSRG